MYTEKDTDRDGVMETPVPAHPAIGETVPVSAGTVPVPMAGDPPDGEPSREAGMTSPREKNYRELTISRMARPVGSGSSMNPM